MKKKVLVLLLCICICATSIPTKVYADLIPINWEKNDTEDNKKNIDTTDIKEAADKSSVVIVVNHHTIQNILKQYKFHGPTGHGFAAEQGNNTIDRLKWNNAIVVGNDNLKNGPDRLILNRDGKIKTYIQDKYYNNASSTINACFEDNGKGNFKYFDGNGNPMSIEVPKDQYDNSIELMRKKIEEGKVPGITDTKEAEKIVKKGHLTYKQAVNLSKPFTKESLVYDAKNGFVSAGVGFGISALLNFLALSIQGENFDEALSASAKEGVITGGKIFAIEIIAGQLTKTGALELFKPSSEALMKALGKDFAKKMMEVFGVEILDDGVESITKQAARLLRSQVLVLAVSTIVFTLPDFIDMFKGRISIAQFIKNLVTAVGSLTTGTILAALGAKLGTAVYPGIGTAIGGFLGGIIGGLAGALGIDWISDQIMKDDAEEMYNIMVDRFSSYCDDYFVNEQEAQNIMSHLSEKMDNDFYKNMFQSNDREVFADRVLQPLFEEEILKRSSMKIPTVEEMRISLKKLLKEVVFIH